MDIDWSKKNLLIVGCGDIGLRVARLARARGAAVTGLVRSEESVRRIEGEGISPILADLDEMRPIENLPTKGALVYYFAPPPGGGEIDTRVRVFCASVEPGEEPRRIVYISTSGVYGDCGGEIVTEETPVNPATARARRRVDAENLLREWGRSRKVEIVILRVTGIYGPGRLPIGRIREGHPVLREEEASYTNRIHADDLADVCIAAADRAEDGDVFNVSDGRPGTMTEYFNAVADEAGLPLPPQISMEEAKRVMTPLMLSYVGESRRMENTLMMRKLGIRLRYPDLRSGIAASLAQEKGARND